MIPILTAIWLFFQENTRSAMGMENQVGLSFDACLDLALAKDPQIQLSRASLETATARYTISQALFDTNLVAGMTQERDHLPLPMNNDPNENTTNQWRMDVGLQKLLRSGLELQADAGVNRRDIPEIQENVENRGTIRLGIRYPLLQGRGRNLVTTQEQAAYLEYQASIQDLNHVISRRLLATAEAYWDYVGAREILTVLTDSEGRTAKLVGETKRLIEADELPANELLQLQANLADRTASRINSLNAYERFRQTLGLVIGLDALTTRQLPDPKSSFPDWQANQPPNTETTAMVNTALESRHDLRALRLRGRALAITLLNDRDKLRPQLDLQASTGFNGLDEGASLSYLAQGFSDRIGGLDYRLSLNYRFPLGNRAAKGQLAETRADQTQNDILDRDLDRRISVAVALTLADLGRNYLELEATRESIRYYRLALDNERKKLRLGFSTLIDVINLEDRLTGVLRAYFDSQTRYMKNVIRLRFETGTLLEQDSQGHFQIARPLLRMNSQQ